MKVCQLHQCLTHKEGLTYGYVRERAKRPKALKGHTTPSYPSCPKPWIPVMQWSRRVLCSQRGQGEVCSGLTSQDLTPLSKELAEGICFLGNHQSKKKTLHRGTGNKSRLLILIIQTVLW